MEPGKVLDVFCRDDVWKGGGGGGGGGGSAGSMSSAVQVAKKQDSERKDLGILLFVILHCFFKVEDVLRYNTVLYVNIFE